MRLVLLHYVAEGELARRRYRLVTAIPALRDREIASVARYQRLFREFIDGWMDDEGGSALRAELMAASVVAAHNHVLRRHLRAETSDPVAEVEAALAEVVALFTPEARQAPGGTTVIALTSDRPIADLLPDLRRVLGVEDTVRVDRGSSRMSSVPRWASTAWAARCSPGSGRSGA